jgi:hypothetical protein
MPLVSHGAQEPYPGVLRVEKLKGFAQIIERHFDQFTLVTHEVK